MKGNSGENIKQRAFAFLEEAYAELERTEKLHSRWQEVSEEIDRTGTWTQQFDELNIGAKMAWRNSNRCIGRLYWKSLKVIDARNMNTGQEIAAALQHHLDYAFNKGDIRSVITVFRQQMPGEANGPRILNHQLLRFAGYTEKDGSVTGDPQELNFTEYSIRLGWTGSKTPFDILPQIVRWPSQNDHLFTLNLPEGMIIHIVHPEFEWFEKLGLKWYGLPVISDMLLEIGGVHYTAAPFNGWYMGTEIGSRNFGDAHRYNLLPVIARHMELDTQSAHSLWKDRALVELNKAVLYSFEKNGVTISSHHEAAEQFLQFESTENKNGRPVTADWTWINPPLSSSATAVFHREYDNTVKGPNFFYQDSLIASPAKKLTSTCPFHASALGRGH